MTITKQPTFSGYILSRIKDNQNFIGIFVGPTGSGKSYGCLRLAENLDPNFSIEQVAFSPKNLMRILNSGLVKKGNALVWEEVGVGMDARKWQSVSNKLMNYLLQTFRRMGIILLMNCPDAAFLDINARKLLHCLFETISINRKKNLLRVKPFLVQVNRRTGDFYWKFLRVFTEEGLLPFPILKLELPSMALRLAYEKKREAYTKKLNLEIEEELKVVETKDKRLRDKKELTFKQEQVLKLLQQGKLVSEIAEIEGVSKVTIYQHVKALKRKGYTIGVKKDNLAVKHIK